MSANTIDSYIIDGTPARIVERYKSLVNAAQTRDFGVLDEDVVVIDTETTGVSFNHDELTQIAAARMKRGEIQEWFVTFVNPGKPIPEEITHLTNIHDSDVADAPSPAAALTQLTAFVGSSNLVAHNAAFDKHFCTKHEEGASLSENIWIDSLDLTRIALPRLKSHRLIDLVHAFDAPISTHRADADVEALCAVYRVLLAAIDAMPNNIVSYIAQMTDEKTWPAAHVFKYFAKEEDPQVDLRAIRSENIRLAAQEKRIDASQIAQNPVMSLSFPENSEVEHAFTSEGIIGGMYDNFETRSEQVDMAVAVNKAFSSATNLVVEAGTGVGKSQAYLVPSALLAKRNGITVGVATKTNALLDQLVNKELPLLSEAMGGVTYTSLKGFSHYICLNKAQRLVDAGPRVRQMGDENLFQASALSALISYIEQTDYDDIDSMKIDYRALPRYEFTTTSADCLRSKCPFFGTRCFVHGVRQRAATVDIVVTNQALLFCDIAVDNGLLPPIRYWVVDEAHGAEDEARRALGYELNAADIRRLASRVGNSDASKNIYDRAISRAAGKVDATDEMLVSMLGAEATENRDGNSAGDTLLFALASKARNVGRDFATLSQTFCDCIHSLGRLNQEGKRSKGYDRITLWINDYVRASEEYAALVECGLDLKEKAEKLIGPSQDLIGLLDDVKGAVRIQTDIASATMHLKELIGAIDLILADSPETYVYAATLVKRGNVPESIEAMMLSMGDKLNETLYAESHSVVYTSATLAIGESFESFNRAMGLGASHHSPVTTCQLPSSYDFDSNMTIYVVDDMPEPNDSAYISALEKLLIGVHRAQQGSTLSLFTNRREMEKCYDTVQSAVRADDLRIVCQKWGVSTKGLRDDFIKDEHLSLFALKSFWEGFDAPGSTLKTVVIPKLPFGRPDDPLSREREQIDSQAWRHYTLPAAVIDMKQAAGRLIRTSTDKGSLVLADKRLITKGYGKIFLDSMPSKNIVFASAAEVMDAIASTHED